jgi:hypothetical protein
MSPNAMSRYGESVAPVKGSVPLGFVDVAACTFADGGTNGAVAVFAGGFGFVGAAGGRNGAVVVVPAAVVVVASVVVAPGGVATVAVVPVCVAPTCVAPVVGVVSVVAVLVVAVVVVGVVSVVGVGVVCGVGVGVKQSPGPKPASSQPGLGHGCALVQGDGGGPVVVVSVVAVVVVSVVAVVVVSVVEVVAVSVVWVKQSPGLKPASVQPGSEHGWSLVHGEPAVVVAVEVPESARAAYPALPKPANAKPIVMKRAAVVFTMPRSCCTQKHRSGNRAVNHSVEGGCDLTHRR